MRDPDRQLQPFDRTGAGHDRDLLSPILTPLTSMMVCFFLNSRLTSFQGAKIGNTLSTPATPSTADCAKSGRPRSPR